MWFYESKYRKADIPSPYTLTAEEWGMVFSGCDCNFAPGSLGQIFNIPSLDPLASNWVLSDHFRLQMLCLFWQRVPTWCWAIRTSWWWIDPSREPLQIRKDSMGLMLKKTSYITTLMFLLWFQKQTTSEWNVSAEQQYFSKRKHKPTIKSAPWL